VRSVPLALADFAERLSLVSARPTGRFPHTHSLFAASGVCVLFGSVALHDGAPGRERASRHDYREGATLGTASLRPVTHSAAANFVTLQPSAPPPFQRGTSEAGTTQPTYLDFVVE